jgi:trehalose/maltose hydrolase-like predicted phosphorylase
MADDGTFDLPEATAPAEAGAELPRPAAQSLADWAASVLTIGANPLWTMRADAYEPAVEPQVESRFALSNGFLGVRSSLEQPTDASHPRTYVAGLFDLPKREGGGPVLIPGPDWVRLGLNVDGQRLTLEDGRGVSYSRTLDLRRGALVSDWRQQLPSGHIVRVRALRLTSLADRSLALQIARIEVDRPATLVLETMLTPVSAGLISESDQPPLTLWRTGSSGLQLAVAIGQDLLVGNTQLPARAEALGKGWQRKWQAAREQPATFSRLIAVSREGNGETEPQQRALDSLRRAKRAGLRRLVDGHVRAWAARWAASDVVVEGDEESQRALRFAQYHLISAADPGDERTSIAARALTGDAYKGRVFWDTEIFLLPFYTLTWPRAARALLMYRYHTLPAARSKAAQLGYQGALYAWESADTGEETAPTHDIDRDGLIIPILCGIQEHHISADVAYAVWQYWQATRDVSFLLNAGAEILLETARFWASRAMLEDDGRYHIRGVIGPDEYHEGVDDNAYTNVMAHWNLERAREVGQLLMANWPDRWGELRDRLGITLDELSLWHEVASYLETGFDPDSNLFEQFAGFFQLEQVDLASYEPRTVPMDVLLGPERTQRSQVIKQADVVMLLALLWDHYPPEVREANFRYYESRCGQGSSLGPAMHALVAARLGDVRSAERYLQQTAAVDLDDAMGNVGEGVHIAALGGLWQAAVFGFAGLILGPDGPGFDPHLPESWHAMSFPFQWRGRRLSVRIQKDPLTFSATLERGRPLTVRVGELRHRLVQRKPWTCRADLLEGGWKEVPS